MIARLVPKTPALLAILGVLGLASAVQAQGNTFNPYGNSGYADYREFGTPMLSNNPALPGQSVLNSRPLISRQRANSYQQYASELEGGDADVASTASRRASTSGIPYYQANQRLNSPLNRVYRPNEIADRKFYEHQQKREAAYAEALQERDPAKRARLLREIDQDSISRPAPATRDKSTVAAGSKPLAAAPASASATKPRTLAPTERRIQAPSPYTDIPVRRTAPPATTPSRPATTARTPVTGTATSKPPAARQPAPAPDPTSVPTPAPR